MEKLNGKNELNELKQPSFLGGVMCSRLSTGDKLICWAKGAAYGDTFTVQDPMYEEGMILQCDKYGSWSPLKDVDLSEFDYA
jgi:hypothetical protein